MVVPKLDFTQVAFVVVDDEPAVVKLISALLKNVGAKKVHEANSATSTLDILTDNNEKIDCVISDHGMEPLTGLELLQKIRIGTNPAISRNLRFLMLTGHGDKEVVTTALALDVDGYMIKPVSLGGLVSSVERAFARKRILKAGSDYATVALPDASGTPSQ